MTTQLVQKRFLKGTQEFEISDDEDAVYVRIKSFLKEEKRSTALSMLDPEPRVNGEELQFYSKFKGRPVLSLWLNNPNEEKFNAFVDALKKKITGDDSVDDAFNSDRADAIQEALARNVYEEPPEFAEREQVSFKPVNAERLAEDITMLKSYLDVNAIRPLLDALEILQAEPDNEAAYMNMLDAFDKLGINQGAVLTYGTYLKVLLSNSMR